MIKLNIHEAKTHLSKYLSRLKAGEVIVLCNRNKPVAEIRPIPTKRQQPRPIGHDKGKLHVPPEFYEPLPDDVLAAFEGSSP